MPWFPVDDTFHSHPKRLAISAAAIGLWTVAGSWANAHLTDGHIPDYVLLTLFPDPPEVIQGWAEELIHAKLWKRDRRGGYTFHDWMNWGSKRSAREVRKLRADRAAAGRKGGLASGQSRSKPSSKPEASASDVGSEVLEPPALPSPSLSGTGSNQGDRPRARPRDNPNFTQNPNPGEGAAARHPSARTPAEAAQAAGISPNGKPARGDTVASFADQIRQAINTPKDQS